MQNQKIYLEHANITVSDMEKSLTFFKTAFPSFKVRGDGVSKREWLHFGDDYTYIALTQGSKGKSNSDGPDYSEVGLSHIGFVVDDVEEISKRLLEAGYKRNFPKTVDRYRIREYFLDDDGNEYEFVEYLSDKLEERNDYSE